MTLIMLTVGVQGIESLTWRLAAERLIRPLVRLLIFILVGLAAGQMIEALGWTRALALVARPVFRFGRLGHRCGAAFMAAFVSGVTANAMLVEFYRNEKITRRQLFLTNFINQFPAFFLHLPTTFFIVIPLTGRAGAFYFLLTFLAALLRTLLLLCYGHFRLPAVADNGERDEGLQAPQKKSHSFQDALTGIRRKLPRRMTMVAVYVIPIYVAVFLANTMGWFTFMQAALAHLVVSSFIPVESLSVVVLSFVAEFTSGFAAAGALMDAGVLTVKQTVVALLIGNILAFPIRALRHQLPHYMGIFQPKMGAQLLVMGQSLRVGSLLAVGTVYFLVG
ncbi:MAG: nucleoside recognition protein [Desulfobacterales bacterium]